MSMPKTLIHQRLGWQPGNIMVQALRLEQWGSRLVVVALYRHPPLEKRFELIFTDCRGIQWYVQKSLTEMRRYSDTPLLTHDLGEENHQRTARLATTLAEVILSYGTLTIEVHD